MGMEVTDLRDILHLDSLNMCPIKCTDPRLRITGWGDHLFQDLEFPVGLNKVTNQANGTPMAGLTYRQTHDSLCQVTSQPSELGTSCMKSTNKPFLRK